MERCHDGKYRRYPGPERPCASSRRRLLRRADVLRRDRIPLFLRPVPWPAGQGRRRPGEWSEQRSPRTLLSWRKRTVANSPTTRFLRSSTAAMSCPATAIARCRSGAGSSSRKIRRCTAPKAARCSRRSVFTSSPSTSRLCRGRHHPRCTFARTKALARIHLARTPTLSERPASIRSRPARSPQNRDRSWVMR